MCTLWSCDCLGLIALGPYTHEVDLSNREEKQTKQKRAEECDTKKRSKCLTKNLPPKRVSDLEVPNKGEDFEYKLECICDMILYLAAFSL